MSVPVDVPAAPHRGALGGHGPLAAVVFGVVVFSTGPVMIGAADTSGSVFSFWRLWIGVAGLAVATLVHGLTVRRWPGRAGWVRAGTAGVAFGLHQLMFMTAIKQTSVVDVTLMNTLAPIVVGALAVPMFGERPGRAFRLWSAVAMTGAAVVVLAGAAGPEGDPVGMLLAAGNVVFYAVFFVWSKQARDLIDPVPFLFGNAVVAALVVSCFLLVVGEAVLPVSARDLWLAVAVAALPGALGHFSVTWSLRWVPANLPPVLMLAIPVMSGGLAWVLLDQAATWAQVAGGALTLAGVAGAIRSATRAGTPSAPEAMVRAEET